MRGIGRLVLVGLVAVVSSCGGGGTSPSNNNGGNGGGNNGGGNGLSVDVLDDHFTPDSLLVTAGSQVTWTWGGYATHNVTFTDKNVGDSGDMITGTYSATFATAGTYTYHCTHHAGMEGKIVVQ